MGFLHASTSIHRFAAPVPAVFDRPHVAETVTRHAFRTEPGDDAPQRSGWVAIHDPLETELTPADLFFQHYLAVGFRCDRRTVPAQLLRLERRRLERDRARERGLPRLGAAARREIKLEVEARLTAQALPAPRIVDCVWNLERGRLYVSGGSRALHDALATCFRRTFDVHLIPMIPYVAAEHVGLAAGTITAVRQVEASTFVRTGTPRPEDVPQLPIGLKELPG